MRTSLLFTFLLTATLTSAQSIIAIKKENLGFQFVNKQTGKAVNQLYWDEAEPFSNGFARVLKEDHFSFVDLNGNPICENSFEAARNFSGKRAAVRIGPKWGFINDSGRIVIPVRYDIVYDFKENITAVSLDRKWYLINKRGDIVKSLDITAFYGFTNGKARVEKDGRQGTLNLLGEVLYTSNILKAPETLRIPYQRTTSGTTTTQCPENIDFELGSFLNWKCFTGRVDSVGTTNVITVNPSPPTNNRHTIYSRVNPSALDAYGLFPTNPPDGSAFAVRLGNTNIGAQAERIQYAIHVPLNDSNFSIKYDYAVVFEDPGHTNYTQPRFTARILDSATNTYVSCASFEYISTSNLPGFARSTVDTGVIYKPWSSVFISLRGYAGKTMYLEFTTADCVRRGHWGYAYVDVEKTCGQNVEVQYQCTSPNITDLTAPPGFQTYNWWNANFTTLLGTGQHVVLNPGPPANSTIMLVMIPYNDFGCRDTMPVKITGVFNANFDLSDTNAICAPHTFTFYNRNIPSASATWDFGDGTTASGDTVSHTYTIPGTYVVTLNVVLPSGCVGTIQKNVTIHEPVGSFYFNSSYFCSLQKVRFDAVVSNADSLFWDFGDGTHLATTLTTATHFYSNPGVYVPYLTVQSDFGCRNTLPGPDTVRIESLLAGFIDSQRKNCGKTTLTLTDTSYSYFGITSYSWNFGDGSTGSGPVVSHDYTVTGTYNVRLIITGISGCSDTISRPIYIKVNDVPHAAITGAASQCSLTATFTSTIQSVDAVSIIQWTSSNGSNGTGITFTVNFPQSGTYTVQLVIGTINGCYDTASHTITVNANPDVFQPNNQSVCAGDATTDINFTGTSAGTTYSWSNNNPSIGLAASGSGDIPAFNTINNGSSPAVATITVSPSSGACSGPVKTFTITVNPRPDVAQPANQVLCRNSTVSMISFNGSVPGTTYSWTNNNTAIGLAASGTGNIGAFTAVNNSNVPVSATIIVTPTINGCTGTPKIFAITINPLPTVDQPADQGYCTGEATSAINFTSPINGTVFTWTNSNTAIGLAANGVGNIPSFITLNNVSSTVTAIITVTPFANNCTGSPVQFNLTVNPKPDVAQPLNQQLCKNAAVAAINFSGTVPGTAYNWTNNNPSIGLVSSGTGNIPSFTAVNNGTTPQTALITVTPTLNGCDGTPKSFTITVDPASDMVQPADQDICTGSSTAAVNFSGNVAGTIYNWTNSNTSIGLAAAGSGNIAPFMAVNNGSTPVSSVITVTPVSGNCSGPLRQFTITVNPRPDVVQPPSQLICRDGIVSAVYFSGNVPGTVYNWTNSNPAIGLAASGTGNIPSFTGLNNTNTALSATVTVTPTVNGCTGASKTFTITVDPVPDVNQPGDQSLCAGEPTSAISFTGTTSGTTYNWTNNNPSIGLAASGTGNIPSFNVINNGTTPVIATITVTPELNNCTGVAQQFTITVNPVPDVVQPADQVLCKNEQTAAIDFNGNIAGATYTWTNSNTLIGLPASGSGNIAPFTAINNTTLPVTATITVTPAMNGCPGVAKTFTITVNPMPAVTQPTDQHLCNNSTTSTIFFATAVNGAVFNWTNDNPSIGLPSAGTGNIASFTAINSSHIPVIATISVTATANGCTGPVHTFTITVDPSAAVDQPANVELCNGSVTTQIGFTSPVGGTTYSWLNDNPSIGLAASGTGDIASFTALNTGNSIVTANITVTPDANGCPGPAKTFTITVKPTASVIQPADQVLCNSALTDAINFNGAVNNSSFSWTNNNISIGLPASGTGNIAAFTALNSGNTAVTATITVTPDANGCPGLPKSFSITVKPTPDVAQPGDQELCNGSYTSNVMFTGNVAGTVFNWTNTAPSIGIPASGTGNILTFQALNNTASVHTATITVTPVANGCPGTAKAFIIVIKPSPGVSQSNDQALCDRTATTPIIFTSNQSGAVITWTNSNPTIGLAASGTGDIPSFIALNNTDTTITGIISVHASANGCSGTDKTAEIAVHPTPNTTAGNDINVCQGKTVQLLATGAAQYSWSPATGLSCTSCANPVVTVNDSLSYVVTGTSAFGCVHNDSVNLKVIRPFDMDVDPGDSLCLGESLGLRARRANSYLWSPAAGLDRVDVDAPRATPQVTTMYRVIGYDGYNCFTDTGYVLVTVGPRPSVEIGADITTSTGTPITFHPVTQNGPIVSYLWTPATGLSCADCPSPSTTAGNTTEYTLTVRNNYGCEATDRIRLTVFCKEGQVFIPNAFTPDGDGLNDILMVRGKGIFVKMFRVFNRWGELVFERTNFNPNDPKFGWDGKVRGVPASPDVFVYTAEVVCDNNVLYTYKGNTTILK